nr:rRNA biogenesis protein RRP5 [Tanacetum cinerariifolium]
MGPPRKSFNKKPDDKLKTFQKSSKKPFKPSQKSNNAIPMQLEDDVPDFPRGISIAKCKTSLDKKGVLQ